MISQAMSRALQEWAEQGGPSFAAELLANAPDPHGLCEAASWRARFALGCEVSQISAVKALAHALNDWLAGDCFHSAVVLDLTLSTGSHQARFDVAVWHPGGGEKSEAASAWGPPSPSRADLISADTRFSDGGPEGRAPAEGRPAGSSAVSRRPCGLSARRGAASDAALEHDPRSGEQASRLGYYFRSVDGRDE